MGALLTGRFEHRNGTNPTTIRSRLLARIAVRLRDQLDLPVIQPQRGVATTAQGGATFAGAYVAPPWADLVSPRWGFAKAETTFFLFPELRGLVAYG